MTRSGDQAGEMGQMLAALGATVHAVAAIAVEELTDPPGLASALSRFAAYDLLVFTSVNGVRFFLPRLAALGVLPAAAPPALCVGPKTASAWVQAGGRVAGVPARFTGEELAKLLPDAEGMDLLVLRPETVATDTAGLLRARGARVDEAVLYRTAAPGGGVEGERLRALLRGGAVQFLTALSPSAVAGLIGLAGGIAPLADLPLMCIGPRTAEAALSAGLTRVHFPSRHTAEGMIEEIVRGRCFNVALSSIDL